MTDIWNGHTLTLLIEEVQEPEPQGKSNDLKQDDDEHCLLSWIRMTHIPSKEAMIAAVRKSGCTNLRGLPLESMTAEAIYTHLVAAKCPCLQRLLKEKKSSHP